MIKKKAASRIRLQPCHQLYSILKEEVKQLLRNIAFVSEQLAIQAFSKHLEHIRGLVADICTSKYKHYYLASVIARKVELTQVSDLDFEVEFIA